MTSNRQHGRCPEEYDEEIKFVLRMEGSIQITSN
jgi:hypothetical protein